MQRRHTLSEVTCLQNRQWNKGVGLIDPKLKLVLISTHSADRCKRDNLHNVSQRRGSKTCSRLSLCTITRTPHVVLHGTTVASPWETPPHTVGVPTISSDNQSQSGVKDPSPLIMSLPPPPQKMNHTCQSVSAAAGLFILIRSICGTAAAVGRPALAEGRLGFSPGNGTVGRQADV